MNKFLIPLGAFVLLAIVLAVASGTHPRKASSRPHCSGNRRLPSHHAAERYRQDVRLSRVQRRWSLFKCVGNLVL